MTRINTIDPSDLLDQHLFAEYREITRISSLARPLSDYGHYTMGTGHMKFFYNKGAFLASRLLDVRKEMDVRNLWNYTPKFYSAHANGLNETWLPTPLAHVCNLVRLCEKLDDKPTFYKYYGKPVDPEHYRSLIPKYYNP